MFEGIYRRVRRVASPAAMAVVGVAAALTADPLAAQPFQFAAIGDTGYSKKSEREFDRMLAAQCAIEDIPLITRDPAFAAFGIRLLW